MNDQDIVSRSAHQPEVQPDIARQAPTADVGVGTRTQGPRRRVNLKAGGPLAVSPQAYGLSSYNTAPALKPLNLSAVADSFAGSGGAVAAQVNADHAPVQRQTAADVADQGFAGGGHEIPHRKAMESSFGMDFGHVKAHTGSAASQANQNLNSHAYAMGNDVAFKTANPEPALVAHELTHTIQHGQGGPAMKGGGIDTAGESEAEAVESAVRAGKPARSALQSVPGAGGPALKKRGPALAEEGGGSKFGMGMSFSMEGFEKSYNYTIWKGHYPWPTPVPGVNAVIDPLVTVGAKGAAKYGGEDKGNLSAQLGVFGECGVGLSGGIPEVAEIYGTVNPAIEGAFTLTKVGDHGGAEHKPEGAAGGEHKPEGAAAEHKPEAKGPASTWSLVGAIVLKASVKIGVLLGGGILDQNFELGSIEFCKLTGIYFDQTGFRKDKIGFEWGPKMQETFTWIKKAIEKAKNMGKAAIQAAKDTGHAIAKGASDFGHWVTSW